MGTHSRGPSSIPSHWARSQTRMRLGRAELPLRRSTLALPSSPPSLDERQKARVWIPWRVSARAKVGPAYGCSHLQWRSPAIPRSAAGSGGGLWAAGPKTERPTLPRGAQDHGEKVRRRGCSGEHQRMGSDNPRDAICGPWKNQIGLQKLPGEDPSPI